MAVARTSAFWALSMELAEFDAIEARIDHICLHRAISGISQFDRLGRPFRRRRPGMTSTSPPAGWYPDPQTPGENRWWDGAAWSPAQPAQGPVAVGNRIANRARIIGWWAIGVGSVF